MGAIGLRGLEAKVVGRVAEHERLSKEYDTLSVQLEERKRSMEAIRAELTASSPRVFISYASEDVAYAQQLYEKLKAKGFRPWLDKKNLLSGQTWKREIAKGIKGCRLRPR